MHFTHAGNLEIRNKQELVWETSTSEMGATRLAIQADGNLVIYDKLDRALWATDTSGNEGARLSLQYDGNLVIYSADDQVLWKTGTGETESRPARP